MASVQLEEGQPALGEDEEETDVGMLSSQSLGIMSSVNQQELQLGLLHVGAHSFLPAKDALFS